MGYLLETVHLPLLSKRASSGANEPDVTWNAMIY